jgi:dihydroorotate dehydrogenase (fumarate)
MPDLTTTYMGLKLRNPIIVSSSDLTKSVSNIKKCEEAGAGAVVLKSIFEEQFMVKGDSTKEEYTMHPEALDYLRSGGLLEYAPSALCQTVEDAKKGAAIPIIASVNCQTPKLWPRYAKQIEGAGADALELNIYLLPVDLEVPGSDYEHSHLEILREVRREVAIPISVKLTFQITSVSYLAHRLADEGADALVLFNWFLEPDIDVMRRKTKNIKGEGNFRQSLRWVALLADRIKCDIASSGGVQNSEGVIKQILAGASAVQACSVFYKKGLGEIAKLLEGVEAWMEEGQYASIEDFRADLSFKKQELSFRDLGEAENFFRAQYLKAYSKFD